MNAWWESFASNLLAETVGLVVGLIVTYIIVDWVVKNRLENQESPLRSRFSTGTRASVALLHFSWAMVLGLVTPAELASGQYALLAERVRSQIVGQPPESLIQRIRSNDLEGVELLAKYTVANVEKITRLADRFAAVISRDVQLVGMVADVEDGAREVALALQGRGASTDITFLDLVDAGIVALARTTWEQACTLDAHIEGAK